MNWDALYIKNIKRRAATSLEVGGTIVIHAHLRALAEAAPEDLEAGKVKGKGVLQKLGGTSRLKEMERTCINFQALNTGAKEVKDEMVTRAELRKQRKLNKRK